MTIAPPDDDYELATYKAMYARNPYDYATVRNLVLYYREHDRMEEAATMEAHLLTLTPPPRPRRKASPAKPAAPHKPWLRYTTAASILGGLLGGIYAATSDTPMSGLAIAWGILAPLTYMTPALIAEDRRVQGKRGILLLTLAGGWTGLAWLVALVWAVSAKRGGEDNL